MAVSGKKTEACLGPTPEPPAPAGEVRSGKCQIPASHAAFCPDRALQESALSAHEARRPTETGLTRLRRARYASRDRPGLVLQASRGNRRGRGRCASPCRNRFRRSAANGPLRGRGVVSGGGVLPYAKRPRAPCHGLPLLVASSAIRTAIVHCRLALATQPRAGPAGIRCVCLAAQPQGRVSAEFTLVSGAPTGCLINHWFQ